MISATFLLCYCCIIGSNDVQAELQNGLRAALYCAQNNAGMEVGTFREIRKGTENKRQTVKKIIIIIVKGLIIKTWEI